MTDKTWLTPSAHAKLVEELERLTTDGRAEIEQKIAEARDHGDLRENAEYHAAKDEQGLMEARIRQIRHILDNGEVRSVDTIEVVDVGTIATVVDEAGDEMDVFIATAENRVPGLVLASPESPLGGALIGSRPGDAVTYEAPAGNFTYRVTAIRPFEA